MKRHMFFDYNDINFNAGLGLLKSYEIFQNSVVTDKVRLTFSSENKFYGRKGSSVSKLSRKK